MPASFGRIDSPANAKIKLAAALKQRQRRERTGLFLCEGVRLAEAAVASGQAIAFALATGARAGEARAAATLGALAARGVPVALVPERLYASISDTETPQGLLLVARQRQGLLGGAAGGAPAAAGDSGRPPLYVALAGVRDPGNLGTIMRTAAAAGASGLLLLRGTADPYGPKAVRASMGAIFALPLATGLSEEGLLAFARERGLALYATAVDRAAQPLYAADLARPCAILLGSEASGLPQGLLAASQRLYIPMPGQAESLNVGAAAAVAIYEAVRQRLGGENNLHA